MEVQSPSALRCPALACGGALVPESAHGITVHRCDRCAGVWFDAEELDRWLAAFYSDAAGPVEHRIPRRGRGGRPCPRCHDAMDDVGWTDLVFDRCPLCHGIFASAREVTDLEHEPAPTQSMSDARRLKEIMVEAGSTILAAEGIITLVMRVLA